MASTKLFLRPIPRSPSIFSPTTHFSSFTKPKFITTTTTTTLRLFSTSTSAVAASSATQFLTYGPSLLKGRKTPQIPKQREEENNESKSIFDESQFTRIFDIAALRVPAKDCFGLEARLRGHLLNWPRIRNIARVPGDDLESEFVSMLGNNENEELDSSDDGEETGSVLYRDKLAKSFNVRGFVRFRNLAKISRPKKRKRKEKKEEESKGKGRKGEFCLVEVVEEERKEMKGLLGDEFRGGNQWRGPTRLLLLDEDLADKNVEEFPRAIQMNDVLEALLPEGMIIPSAFETVGHIAHLNLRDEHLPYKNLIAKVVLDKNKPKVQTVVNKIDAIHNDYRTMQLEVLAGNHSLVTVVVENGIRFNIDLATVYWNSRLATERQRLLSSFNHNDVVCDVFAGVGPIAISAAKIVKRVYANDLNPCAVDYLERNCVLNKLERKIEVYNMDGRRFINALFTSDKAQSITQVVMNLPNDAAEYLDAFRGIFRDKPKGTRFTYPRIHVYGFSKARDPEFDFHERIRIALSEVAVDVEMRRVRHVAPGKWMLCASFILPESVAFAKSFMDL